jgi:superfamily I DNA and RNA helicase
METVVASARLKSDPDSNVLIRRLKDRQVDFAISEAVIYYDFPTFRDYEDDSFRPDVMVLSKNHGVIAFKLILQEDLDQGDEHVQAIDENLTQFNSLLFSRMVKSKTLRAGKRELIFPIETVAYAPNERVQSDWDGEFENAIVCQGDLATIFGEQLEAPLSDQAFDEARSIIEGAKALGKPKPREVAKGDTTSKAAILAALEAEIANFDVNQRAAAISLVEGPQRIRGLAGSGKTVILAMKAAHIHLNHPNKKILLTFHTKSLYSHIKQMVTRFYRHWKEEDPNWSNVHIRHAWGGSSLKGVYYQACIDHGLYATPLNEVRHKRDPFDHICGELLRNTKIKEKYDYILMDEAQDFPNNFFRLCYALTKGGRDEKPIIWAYDELQNIINVKMRTPKELFGEDSQREPLVDLERAGHRLPEYLTNDVVLHKCYRNPRVTLVGAHALGFGIYSDSPVQMLQGKDHWEDVGYEVRKGDCTPGQDTIIFRPEANSPLSISARQTKEQLIQWYKAADMDDEVAWCTRQIAEFIEGGLNPEDIMVITLDNRHARSYFERLSMALADNDMSVNDVLGNPYGPTTFAMEGKVTLTTVFKAKGNEAAAVVVIGIDAIYVDRKTKVGRNKIFTAFTRSKAWLRVSGVGDKASFFFKELETAIKHFPEMRFIYPHPAKVETIERDMNTKAAAKKALREKYLRELEQLGIDEEEMEEFFEGKK